MNLHEPDDEENVGWGGPDEGTRRIDDCIPTFGGDEDEEEHKGVGER